MSTPVKYGLVIIEENRITLDQQKKWRNFIREGVVDYVRSIQLTLVTMSSNKRINKRMSRCVRDKTFIGFTVNPIPQWKTWNTGTGTIRYHFRVFVMWDPYETMKRVWVGVWRVGMREKWHKIKLHQHNCESVIVVHLEVNGTTFVVEF